MDCMGLPYQVRFFAAEERMRWFCGSKARVFDVFFPLGFSMFFFFFFLGFSMVFAKSSNNNRENTAEQSGIFAIENGKWVALASECRECCNLRNLPDLQLSRADGVHAMEQWHAGQTEWSWFWARGYGVDVFRQKLLLGKTSAVSRAE